VNFTDDWPHERKCPVCGKIFAISYLDEWAYCAKFTNRTSKRYFCSHRCMRQYKAQKAANLAKNKADMLIAAKIKRLLGSGMEKDMICEQLNVSRQLVNYYEAKAKRGGKK